MSVISHESKEFASVYFNIVNAGTLRSAYFRMFREDLDDRVGVEEKDIENRIACWVDRMYLANQLAYFYQYDKTGQNITIKRLQDKDLEKGTLMNSKQLYELLGHLKYNLYTNGVRCFFSEDDMEKVELIKKVIADEIVKWAEKGGWEGCGAT